MPNHRSSIGSELRLKARIDKTRQGAAYLIFDDNSFEDLFVPARFAEEYFHGDRVLVAINDNTMEVASIELINHRATEWMAQITGPKQANILTKKGDEPVTIDSPLQGKKGDYVKVVLKDGRRARSVQLLGQDIPASHDCDWIAREHGLVEHHSPAAKQEAQKFPTEINEKSDPNRKDLRDIPFITIDGKTARDFDDAIFVERHESTKWKLWVAIADVSHYVTPGSKIDIEAHERGTSVYFPERAFHMLPRELSEELCSLKPNVPRYAFVSEIIIDDKGKIEKTNLHIALIESRRRATYEEIEEEKNSPTHADMFALYRLLRGVRNTRGSMDFDLEELEILVDSGGEPTQITIRQRLDSHRLIEEFMIKANEAVTEWAIHNKAPFIYRIHAAPTPIALAKFLDTCRSFGVSTPKGLAPENPASWQKLIENIRGHTAEHVLNYGLLRSMKQAVYSVTNEGHFGLASTAYTHFTSPIRRYPDLQVHRELKRTLLKQSKDQKKETALLKEVSEHCSYRERLASEAERDALKLKQVRFMARRLGEIMTARVEGVQERGCFLRTLESPVDGFLPIQNLKDYYTFNEGRHELIGRRSNNKISVGSVIQVQCVKADLIERSIEFSETSQEEKSLDTPRTPSKIIPRENNKPHPPRPKGRQEKNNKPPRRRRRA